MLKFGIFVCLLAALVGAADPNCIYSIFKGKGSVCMGALVGKQHIVTTARCVYRTEPSKLTVAKVEGSKEADKINVVRVVVHPFYYPPNDNYDVAILVTNKDLENKCDIEKNKILPNATLIVLKENNKATIVEPKPCQEKLGNTLRLSSKMLCASVLSKVPGGSPLIKRGEAKNNEDKLIGVAFHSKDLLTVFTKFANSEISSFIDKIVK